MNIICYQNENSLSLVIPATNIYDIHSLAKIVVPGGVAYKIISSNDIPQDRTFRNAWSLDFSNPDGYGDPK